MSSIKDILGKYDKLEFKKNFAYKIIPNEILHRGLTIDELGLYIFYVIYSNQHFMTNNQRSVVDVNYKLITKYIYQTDSTGGRFKTNQAKIEGLTKQLCNKGVISISKSDTIKDYFNIKITDLDRTSFCKIYYPAIKIIKMRSKGLSLLKRYAAYTVFRYQIFEGEHGSYINEKTGAFFASVLGVSRRTADRILEWLRENKVLAYYKCVLNNPNKTRKYYYSDIKDCKELTNFIEAELRSKEVITQVIE